MRIRSDPHELNNLYGNSQYAEITDHLKEQLKLVRAEVNDSDAHYPPIAKIVSDHWQGGEDQAIRISPEVAKNPTNSKRQNDEKE